MRLRQRFPIIKRLQTSMRDTLKIIGGKRGPGGRTRSGSMPNASYPAAGRSTSESNRSEQESASGLLLRGRRLEAVDRCTEALVLYDRALAIPEAKRTPLDTFSILHHVGNCSSNVGDIARAWNAYLAAARLHREHLGPEHLHASIGASLGEAGLLLVDYRPDGSISDVVDQDLVWEGLEDVLRQASNVLLAETPPTGATAMPVHRQLTGMMVLAGYASAGVRLSDAGRALYHCVATEFFERYQVRRKTMTDALMFIAFTFQALARLCDAVGEQEDPERKDVPPSFEEVGLLARTVGDAFLGEPRPMMMRWLGSYLREHRGATWATDEILEAGAGEGWATNDHLATAADE